MVAKGTTVCQTLIENWRSAKQCSELIDLNKIKMDEKTDDLFEKGVSFYDQKNYTLAYEYFEKVITKTRMWRRALKYGVIFLNKENTIQLHLLSSHFRY